MHLRRLLVLLFVLFSTSPGRAAEPALGLQFTAEGLQIDGGSIGQLNFEYPTLLDAAQKPIRKLLEKTTTKSTATLQYEGGLRLELSVAEKGRFSCKFAAVPAEVKFVQWDMHIPILFNQGGRWQAGGQSGDFPKEKPAKPHLLQDHAESLTITNYVGRSLVLAVPQYTFLQLSDNREWNWAIFHFKGVTPLAAERPELTFVFSIKESAGQAPALVDELGQLQRETWPAKVKDVTELHREVEAEKTWYASLHPPQRGRYGGLVGSREKLGLQATGFFHLEQKGERSLLVDPAGEAFFHLGVCSANPNEDYTLVRGRESAFTWLPKGEPAFATAWKPDSMGAVFSFHLANQIRKYGRPYERETYTAQMIERLRAWGFNSFGAFSDVGAAAQRAASFPTVAHLPLDQWKGVERLPGIEQVWDPFEEKTRARIEENFARELPPHASDPLIIGYFQANEPIYENIRHVIPTLKASAHACKRRFVQGLVAKYQTADAFNGAWGLAIKNFDELGDLVMPSNTGAAKADVQEFVALFEEEMFRFVAEAFHRHDHNHLLLGSRLMPGTIQDEQLCRILGQYVDVMSFNYYTNAVDLALLRRIHQWTGKPIMLSEFYWSAVRESGLTGGREVATQQERGLAYRNYVEQSASLGFVVGIEWFTLIDQAATGRWFQGFEGERANTGLLSVTDRPWKEALAEMMKTNYDIYPVWLGERPPFAWDDERFRTVR